MIAVTNESVSELLVLCERAGLERAAAYAALADSAVASPFVQYKQAAFLAPDDAPVAFTPLLMLKDLALAEALAAEVGAELPAVEAARSRARAHRRRAARATATSCASPTRCGEAAA